jgi:hypothetical protein
MDGTLIPLHDHTISAASKNCRRSVHTQIICSHRHRVLVAGRCWPGNLNDVIVGRHTVAHLLTGHDILSDGGYRGIAASTTPRRGHTGRIIRDDHQRTHRRIRARLNRSSPDLKTGRHDDNVTAAATPSTTASKSSSDTGTSRPTTNYGSTPSPAIRLGR